MKLPIRLYSGTRQAISKFSFIRHYEFLDDLGR